MMPQEYGEDKVGVIGRLFRPVVDKLVNERLEELAEGLFTEEDRGWTALGDDDQGLTADQRKTVREQAWRAYRLNPLAKRQVKTMVSFLVGRGLRIIAANDDDQKVVDDFRKRERFDLKLRELLGRLYIEGETFPVLFASQSDGTCKLREFKPAEIVDIVMDKDDYEKVIGYHRVWTYRTRDFETGYETTGQDDKWLKSEEELTGDDGTTQVTTRRIMHWKLNVVGGMLRGESDLQSHLYHLSQYSRLLKSRTVLNYARANFAWDLKLIGATSKQIEAKRTDMRTKGAPSVGSVFIHNEREELSPKGLNISAGDASDDIRALRLMCVAGSGLPEFMVTGDASNANYSSTAIALQAFKKTIEEGQDLLEDWLQELFGAVLGYAHSVGKTGGEKGEGVKVEFPVISIEDLESLAKALSVAQTSGWASRETCAARMGFDYQVEEEKIQKEEAAGIKAAGGVSDKHPEE
jgi:hypothetical protein